jgi:hypothetical protein
LRSHCRPKINSRPPTTTRSTSIGSEVMVGPSAATITVSASVAAPTPLIADGQLRVAPMARTIVNASTASTVQARNTDRTSPSSAPLMLLVVLRRHSRAPLWGIGQPADEASSDRAWSLSRARGEHYLATHEESHREQV